MTSFHLYKNKTKIGKKCFIIAEIGQNHQGCLNTAKDMIITAKECGADCVKFQKSHLEEKFTQKALQQQYQSKNSFGSTYGDHKRFLEFSIDNYKDLISYAKSNDILLTASAMDQTSYNQLRALEVPFIKIGSGDNNNWLMLEKVSDDKDMPAVISTGMLEFDGVKKLQELFKDRCNVGIMYCVSSYPTKSEDVHLRFIEVFKKIFPQKVIGYSGHESTPIVVSLGAVALGAKIIERHFTLDKSLKGSDHACSLMPSELTELVRLIRILEQREIKTTDTDAIIEVVKSVVIEGEALYLLKELNELRLALSYVTEDEKKLLDCELSCFNKLRKTLVYSRDISAGKIIQKTDFCIKVHTEHGIPTEKYHDLLGKVLLTDVFFEDAVQYHHFQ